MFQRWIYRWSNVDKSTLNQRGYHIDRRHNVISTYISVESTLSVYCERFCNIRRKTPKFESLFNKVAGTKACNFLKKILQRRCFRVNIARPLGTFFFYRAPLLAASVKTRILTVFPLISAPLLIKFWNCELWRLLEGVKWTIFNVETLSIFLSK